MEKERLVDAEDSVGMARMVASPPCQMMVFPVSQAFPSREGAPKGRIGHRRYERQMRKAERCATYVEGSASP